MQKGFFVEQQKPVFSVEDKKRGTITVFICLNEEKQESVTPQESGMETETTTAAVQWVYDFHSFTVPIADVDLDDIKANPENYLDYDPDKKQDTEIADLKKENAELRENMSLLQDCVMDLSEQIYS